MYKKYKSSNGITLVALVITIIALLILAGVSIAILSGNNGILGRTKEAKEEYEKAAEKESVALAMINAQNMGNRYGEVTQSILQSAMNNQFGDGKATVVDNGDGTFNVVMNNQDGRSYIVDNDGNVLDNRTTLLIEPFFNTTICTGTRTIIANNGKVTFLYENNKRSFVITATEAPIGKKFAYWLDQNNNIISYSSLQECASICSNMIFTPVYSDKDKNIEKQNCINVYETTETTDGYLCFTSFTTLYDDNIDSTKFGIIATSNEKLANNENLIVESTNSEILIRGGEHQDYSTFSVNWSKSNVGTSKWFCRGYATITYTDGTIKTIYSNNIASAQK